MRNKPRKQQLNSHLKEVRERTQILTDLFWTSPNILDLNVQSDSTSVEKCGLLNPRKEPI